MLTIFDIHGISKCTKFLVHMCDKVPYHDHAWFCHALLCRICSPSHAAPEENMGSSSPFFASSLSRCRTYYVSLVSQIWWILKNILYVYRWHHVLFWNIGLIIISKGGMNLISRIYKTTEAAMQVFWNMWVLFGCLFIRPYRYRLIRVNSVHKRSFPAKANKSQTNIL